MPNRVVGLLVFFAYFITQAAKSLEQKTFVSYYIPWYSKELSLSFVHTLRNVSQPFCACTHVVFNYKYAKLQPNSIFIVFIWNVGISTHNHLLLEWHSLSTFENSCKINH